MCTYFSAEVHILVSSVWAPSYDVVMLTNHILRTETWRFHLPDVDQRHGIAVVLDVF